MDLDEASYISEDAGIELYSYEINEKDPELGGKGLEATLNHLNNGVLSRLFEEYSRSKPKHSIVQKELCLVFLGKLFQGKGRLPQLILLSCSSHARRYWY